MKTTLSENVKNKLAETVEAWAEETLGGKPAILCHAMFFTLERKLIEKTDEINKKF